MTRIELEIHDDVISTLTKIKNINDSGIELVIPQGSVLFDNILNLKIIEKELDKRQMGIQFITDDECGNNLIEMLDEKRTASFISEDLPKEELQEVSNIVPATASLPKFSLPNISFKLPRFKTGITPLLIGIPLALAGIYILLGNILPKADVHIVVNSVPLTRSITVKVGSETQTNAENKSLKGSKVTSTLQESMDMPTTGEKISGTKAKGEVTLYNKTEDDITLKKGSIVYKDDLKFTLDDSVTVDKKTEQTDPANPGTQVYKLGEATVEVTAYDYGDNYNLKSDTDLTVKGYRSSEMTAKNKDKLTGGKTQTSKIVAAEDQKALSEKLTQQITQDAISELTKKLGSTQKLISGSVNVKVTGEAFSNKVGDPVDKLTLTQTATIEGLTYYTADLNTLMDKVVESLIPQGYVISEKDKQIEANALGSASSGDVTPNEADLQVTLKTYIVTDINTDAVKNSLAGKPAKEAKKYLDSLKEIKSYSFDIAPVLPFFNSVPKDRSKINVEIEKQ